MLPPQHTYSEFQEDCLNLFEIHYIPHITTIIDEPPRLFGAPGELPMSLALRLLYLFSRHGAVEPLCARMTVMKIQSKVKAAVRREPDQDVLNVRNQKKKPSRSTTPTTEFGRTLTDLLGKTFQPGEVNEEELFAATTHQLIFNRYGATIAEDFKSAFKLNMVDKPERERFASAERATKESLKFFVNSTLITREEAQQIRQLAFTAAQLDDNLEVAWDSLGDTKATTSFAKGEKLVQERLEASGNAPVIASRRGGRTGSAEGYAAQASSPKARRGRGSVKKSA